MGLAPSEYSKMKRPDATAATYRPAAKVGAPPHKWGAKRS
jgi:hypothetical protein